MGLRRSFPFESISMGLLGKKWFIIVSEYFGRKIHQFFRRKKKLINILCLKMSCCNPVRRRAKFLFCEACFHCSV